MAKPGAAQNGQAPQNEEPEFEIIEVDSDGVELHPATEADADDDADDQQSGHDDGDDGDDGDDDDDERVGHAEGDQEEQASGQRRRVPRNVENRAKRQRRNQERRLQDQRIETLVQTVVDLQTRVAQSEGRALQYNAQTLQNQIQQVDALLEQARDTYQTCLANNDHAGASEVNDTQFDLREQKRVLSAQLQRAKQQAQQPQGQQRPRQGQQAPQVDPAVIARAEVFAEDHSWYDPTGGDPDSRKVLQIDNALLRQGLDPRSGGYWQELRARVREQLPHRFSRPRRRQNTEQEEAADGAGSEPNNGAGAPRLRGPRMAAPAQNGGQKNLAKNQVRVTPERKAAMVAAGKWDDPVLRNKQLAAYAKYDRDNAARTGR